MTRFILPMLAATLLIAAPADAHVKHVTSVVSASAPTVTVQLAKGSKVHSLKGGTAKAHGRTVSIAVKRSPLTLVTSGRGPQSFRTVARCTVKHRKGKLAVTCPAWHATGAIPLPQPNPGPAPAPAPAPEVGGVFAPYVDVAGWPAPTLTDSGAKTISLAFVTSEAGACNAAWGGIHDYQATGAGAYQRAQVEAFEAAGGSVVPSFGGASGTELALVCGSTDLLAAQYQGVIDAYHAKRVDFDVEGDMTVGNEDANKLRGQAIAKLQHDNPGLVVTLTLSSEASGLPGAQLALLDKTLAQGADIGAVNAMTMDFSGVVNGPGVMGGYAKDAGSALHGQLATRYPALTDAQVWRKVGVTPMVGVNDFAQQNFTLDNAREVLAWAQAQKIGMIGEWSLTRDSTMGAGYEYANIFKAFS